MSGERPGNSTSDEDTRAHAREDTGAPAPAPSPLERLRVPAEMGGDPRAQELLKALATFEFGDYRRTRALIGPILADDSAPAPIRLAAEKMSTAMGFEPGAVIMLAGCTAFFLLILWLVY